MAGLTRNFLRCARIWSTPFNRTQISLQFKTARILHTGVPYFSARKDLLSCVQLEIDMENVQPLPPFKKFEVCLSILSPLMLMQCTVYFHAYLLGSITVHDRSRIHTYSTQVGPILLSLLLPVLVFAFRMNFRNPRIAPCKPRTQALCV